MSKISTQLKDFFLFNAHATLQLKINCPRPVKEELVYLNKNTFCAFLSPTFTVEFQKCNYSLSRLRVVFKIR